MNLKDTKKKYERIPWWAIAFLCLAAASAIILFCARRSVGFASFFFRYVSAPFRAVLAFITNLLPFSLAELFIIFLPIIITILIIYAVKKQSDSIKAILVYSLSIISIASLFFSAFVFSVGVGYHTPSLYERFEIPNDGVTADQLRVTALKLADKVNDLSSYIDYTEEGYSVMPYSLSQMNKKFNGGYKLIAEKYNFVQGFKSNVKPVLFSVPMSYTHLTGIYSVFTGEANLNVDFPDYTLPYTAAHEMAHQRGISRENEANFIAFIVSMEIDDPYIQYSAYLNMYEYVAYALYYADAEAYAEVYSRLENDVKGELAAYSRFFEKYRGSKASEVSSAINDAYLKANGTKEGTQSYGLVVDLAVAYFEGALDEN